MQDCEMTITVRDNVMKVDGRGLNLEEMAKIAGFLQVIVGLHGLNSGWDMDDVKSTMLDIHLAAMEELEERVREESSGLGGSP